VTKEVLISERPAEAQDRAVPGHWEGDLILGLGRSAIGTLVERSTRFTMLLHLPPMPGHGGPKVKNGPALAGHGAEAVRDAITTTITTLPEQLRRSLTWDQGAEMSQHAQLRIDTGLQVYSPFGMTMSREDGEQPLQGIALHMPKGVSGTLSSVTLCGEQQADEGTCGSESLIGETIVSVGVGGDPYTVRGGKVYITGPYRGAPFGLSIVNPAKAGPYDLGQVIVRAKLEVNEETAAITVTTDDEGPYKIPTIIDGIPLQIKHVNVNINRPGFTFNATNCNPLQITGDLLSTEGATSTLQVPYQVTNCAVLAFKPKLEASTSGKTSRADGASLHVKLGYPAGPYDANIAKVKVELPKALPSRLTTLQKACTAQVFEANPAACPAASIVGHATATTPELPVPLTGPAYFVSHGGESFPSLIIVLQGYGVTVHLVGSTFINEKTGSRAARSRRSPTPPSAASN
jgi:hypothetical protein